MNTVRFLLALVCAAMACACNASGRDAPSGPASAVPASVVPGATCEHGVVSELCPKCNPSLVAVYQAKGNWCAEHGMPESFCPVCHPEAKGQPPESVATAKTTQGAKVPTDGMKVTLRSPELAAQSGIAVAVAVKAPPRSAVRFPARVVYDATKTAEVSARSGGVVRSVAVDVGTTVERGRVLATLDSASIGADRAKLVAAQARLQAAEENQDRVSKLEKDGITARRDVLEANTARDAAKAEVNGLVAELGVSGASAGAGASYSLKSPLAGVVTQRNATIGRAVEAEHVLFQVVDASTLWAELDVPEQKVGGVSPGDEVALSFSALPDAAFAGRVVSILPEVSRETRTVTVRAAVDNKDLRLRANMFGEAALLRDTPPEGVTVPRSAIQSFGEDRIVFVRESPTVYHVRHVRVGTRDADLAVVVSGLAAGEEVVTTGSFLLRTETLKDSIGAGCCAAD